MYLLLILILKLIKKNNKMEFLTAFTRNLTSYYNFDTKIRSCEHIHVKKIKN